jgi:Ni/Fe-hydrogenase 1 B-type cytochrome subunit
MAEQIRRVTVWSGRQRLVHWLTALSTLGLVATGWLIGAAPTLALAAVDYHYMLAAVLSLALLVRLWLGLFGQGAERFEQLWPTAGERDAMRASLMFYLTLGRSPLPNWYAHNPLWKPLYWLLLILLAAVALTGWIMPGIPVVGRLYLPRLHEWLATGVSMWLALHLFSVLLQDIRGGLGGVSAMLGGDRYFSVDRDRLVRPEIPEVSIRLDDIDPRR